MGCDVRAASVRGELSGRGWSELGFGEIFLMDCDFRADGRWRGEGVCVLAGWGGGRNAIGGVLCVLYESLQEIG